MEKVDLETLKTYLRYDQETGVFTWRISTGSVCAGSEASHVGTEGYRRIRLRKRIYEAHRLAWFYVYGEWPKGCIDHINGDRLDNRIANLRDTTKVENARNTLRPKGRNPYIGVSKDRGRWRVAITPSPGTPRVVKYGFETPEQARDEYLRLKAIYHPHARKTSA